MLQDCIACNYKDEWRFMCRARWSEREKARSQSLQWKGLSPVCLRLWRVSSSERANRQPQSSHWQM